MSGPSAVEPALVQGGRDFAGWTDVLVKQLAAATYDEAHRPPASSAGAPGPAPRS